MTPTPEKVAASGPLLDFWSDLVTHPSPEKPWLFNRSGKSQGQFSYKDIHAQAHCIAAYLLHCGVKKGEQVAVISEAGPFSLCVDLAIQFTGAASLFLPKDVSSDWLFEWIRTSACHHVFLDDPATFLRLDQLRPIKGHLKWIFLDTDDVENLETEKIATFDFLILQGKAIWRETTQEMRISKAGVALSDTYSLVFNPESPDRLRSATFQDLLRETQMAVEELKGLKEGPWVEWIGPHRLMQRSYGFFAAMRLGIHVYTPEFGAADAAFFKDKAPAALFFSPPTHKQFYEALPTLFFSKAEAGKKAIDHANRLCERRETYLMHGKPVPFFLRLRYNRLKRTTFARLKKKMGGKVGLLLMDQGELDGPAERFFTYMGLTQRQIKG